MKLRKLANVALCAGLLFGVTGCPDDNDGPLERAGEEVDEAFDDKDDSADDAGDKLNEAKEDLKDAADEATDSD